MDDKILDALGYDSRLVNEPPDHIIRKLKSVYSFNLNAHAIRGDVCSNFFTGEEALTQCWNGTIFLSPPKIKGVAFWINKAKYEVSVGNARSVVCLLPAKTYALWFQDAVEEATAVTLIKGRLYFGPKMAWIAKYTEDILKVQSKVGLRDLLDKIGGQHIYDDVAMNKIKSQWGKLKYRGTFNHWLESDNLEIPTPDHGYVFIVYGSMTHNERRVIKGFGFSALVRYR